MAVVEAYKFNSGNIPVNVSIESDRNEFVLIYRITISQISANTEILLEKIRNELVDKVKLDIGDVTDPKKFDYIKMKFQKTIISLVKKYLPDLNDETLDFFTTYLMHKSFGLGRVELLMSDTGLEEIVINNADEPVWVYHHKYGWLKTNIQLVNEEQVKHYATVIGRRVGRSITLLSPLLDAHLEGGDRVNATLQPISTKGNTITIRKFAAKPITITNFILNGAISVPAASLIWLSMEYEMSALVSGGTASGKCVSGDTRIILGDGSVKNIQEIVEAELALAKHAIDDGWIAIPSALEVFSFDKNYRIKKSKVTHVWKRKADNLFKVRTRSGREITATGEHPFFRTRHGDVEEIRADALSLGERIACARRVPVTGRNIPLHIFDAKNKDKLFINLPEILTSEEITLLRQKEKRLKKEYFDGKKDVSLERLLTLLHDSGISPRDVEKRIIAVDTKTSPLRIGIPKYLDTRLASLLGYIIGDGHIHKNGPYINFANNNVFLREKVKSLFEQVFGVRPREKIQKDRVAEVVVGSAALVEIFSGLFGIPRGNKAHHVVVPPQIFRADSEAVKAFLRSLFDCESCIGKSEIEFSSASHQLIEDIRSLLLRYGIVCSVRRRCVKGFSSSRLFIYGRNVLHYKDAIHYSHPLKAAALNVFSWGGHSNSDFIPHVQTNIQEGLATLQISRKEFSEKIGVTPRAVRWYLSGGKTPTLPVLGKIASVFEDTGESSPQLSLLLESDLYWDEVVEIHPLSQETWVYDLSVEEKNFVIANGIIAHNTSFLGALCSFFPPNQRIISVEDSVTGDSELLYREKGVIKKGCVGDLIDSKIRREKLALGDGSEIYENKEIEVLSMDKKGKVSFTKPSLLIRHHVKKPLLQVKLISGKEITITKDHSLFGLVDNGVKEIKCKNLRIGSFIATPRKIEYFGAQKEFDLSDYLEVFEEFMVKGEPIKKLITDHGGKIKNRTQRRYYLHQGVLPVKIFKELVPHIYEGDKERLCLVSRRGNKEGRTFLPFKICIDNLFSTIIGMWLADGCYDKKSLLISDPGVQVRELVEEFAARFGSRVKMHTDGITLMINSKCLRVFFERVLELKGNAYTKRVPEWIFGLHKEITASLIRGYFNGDGCTKKYEVCVSSSSHGLLKDIQTLLLRFEIPLRIGLYLKRDKTYEARISGSKFLKIFHNEIKFIQHDKNLKLLRLIDKKPHDVKDVIPLTKKTYLYLKHHLGVSLKNSLRYSSWKSWHGRYKKSDIGRMYLKRLLHMNGLHHIAMLEPEAQKIIELSENDLLWDRVVEIKEIPYTGYVYDFSVPGNESFVCNNIIAHNTREVQLPKYLHWIPMNTRQANVEGKGGVEMLDLIVNTLRMRPDRIVVGEIRRKKEAETLFEAMHTGHSVYATVHANNAEETVNRLTNPPIEVPKTLLPAVSLIVNMYRNRRTGVRRVFQVAEITAGGDANVLQQLDLRQDKLVDAGPSEKLMPDLQVQTGLTEQEIAQSLEEKGIILQWLAKNKIDSVDAIGKVVATYYTNKDALLSFLKHA